MPDVSMHFLSGPLPPTAPLYVEDAMCVCESMCIWVGGVFSVSLGVSVHVCVCICEHVMCY